MINFKKILSFENNIKYCNYLISVAPLLYIVSIIFFEITVFFSSILIAYAIFKKKIFFKKDTLLILFFLFYLILLLSSLINGDTESIIKSFVYIRFILFFLFITYFYNFNSFKLLSKTIFITLIFIYFDIIYQLINGKDIFGYEPGLYLTRYQGPFGDELISGAYIKKYLFIGMIIILSYQKNLYVNIFIFLSVFIAFITGEKVSFILISFGVFIYSLIYLKKNKYLFLSILILISLILSFLLYPNIESSKLQKIQQRYTKDFKIALGYSIKGVENQNTFSNSVHIIHFATALELFKSKPLFGHGLKGFRKNCHSISLQSLKNNFNIDEDRGRIYKCSSHPHNFYFEIISETGIFSLIIIFMIFFYIFKNALNIDNEFFRVGLLLCLIVHIFPIATTGSFFTNHNSFHLWMTFGLIQFAYLRGFDENS